MSIQGRLSKERFGFSMPVHAPSFPSLPIYYRNAGFAGFQYVTDGELAAELLPAALHLTDPPMALLALIEYPWTTIGPYNEAIQYLFCTYQGRPVQYVAHILVTSDVPMAAGREAYGYPKKVAHIEFTRENEVLAASVERPRGFRICSALMRIDRPLPPGELPMLPNVCLRAIPGAAGAELIEVGSDVRVREAWAGTGSCQLTGISELDPWHRIPVRQMLGCAWVAADLELKEGRVLEVI